MRIREISVWSLLILCLWYSGGESPLYGQLTKTSEETVVEPPAPQTDIEIKEKATIATLRKIIQATEAVQEQIRQKETELNVAETEEKKVALLNEIQELGKRVEDLDKNFESVATGVDLEKFVAKPAKTFDWQQEIQIIVGPIIEELKEMTARPREMEELRSQVAYYEKRLPLVENAIKNVQRRIELATAQKLKKQLISVKEIWEEKKKEVENQLAVARYQLDEKLESQQSFVKSTQSVLREFFKSRGLNLILSLAAFIVIFWGMRWLYRFVYKVAHLNKPGKRQFFIRLFDVIFHLLTVLAATVALLLVLYVSGDWVLLGVALIFLFGIAWTAKQTFPLFWEQTKLLLNLSTVREGERLIYDGLPWQVRNLSFYTKLHNPALKGGLIRLPLRELIGFQSRPFYKDEPWFPCKEEDLVILADGAIGKVILQTPERVVLDTLGGCHKTYPTLSFLQQNPINYSINNFGVFVTFGLDYAHQAKITKEIPELLQNMLAEELAKEEFGKELISLVVQFKEAAESSLNLLIAATFSGQVALSYFPISRALQRIAVEACNKYDWGIPFMQVTIHHPDSSKPAELNDEKKSVEQTNTEHDIES